MEGREEERRALIMVSTFLSLSLSCLRAVANQLPIVTGKTVRYEETEKRPEVVVSEEQVGT